MRLPAAYDRWASDVRYSAHRSALSSTGSAHCGVSTGAMGPAEAVDVVGDVEDSLSAEGDRLSILQALGQEGGGEAAVQASCCDVWKAATAVGRLDRSWTEELSRVAPLPTHLCRDLVVITTHPYEAVYAAGGLISYLAMQGAEVEVLAVTDGDGAAPLQPPFRRRDILAAYRRLGVPEVRRHRLQLQSGKVSDAQSDLIAAFKACGAWRRGGATATRTMMRSASRRRRCAAPTTCDWCGTCARRGSGYSRRTYRGATSASSHCPAMSEHA